MKNWRFAPAGDEVSSCLDTIETTCIFKSTSNTHKKAIYKGFTSIIFLEQQK